MSNPLEHALVPVAAGALRTDGRDLIVGETVTAFWTWPKYIQDLHLKERRIVWMNVADATKANEKAEELRNAGKLKEEQAKVKGTAAELQGVRDLVVTLEKQRDELLVKAGELEAQLEAEGVHVKKMKADEGRRPEDDESKALEHKPESDLDEAAGLKIKAKPVTPEPKDEDEQGQEDPEQLKAMLAGGQAASVWIEDLSLFGPRYFAAADMKVGQDEVVTNHPKRSWFAQIRRTETGFKVT